MAAVVLIHYHAALLLAKGARFYPHPAGVKTTFSRAVELAFHNRVGYHPWAGRSPNEAAVARHRRAAPRRPPPPALSPPPLAASQTLSRTSGRSAPLVLVPGFDKSNIEECD